MKKFLIGTAFCLLSKTIAPVSLVPDDPLVQSIVADDAKAAPSLIPHITVPHETVESALQNEKKETAPKKPKEITTIVWDLSFTLIETSKFGLASEIGLGDCLVSTFFGGKGVDEMRGLICSVLERGSGKQKRTHPYLDDSGKPMPNIMVDWFNGTQTPDAIHKRAHQYIQDWDKEIGFDSAREKRIVEKAIETVIDPQILAKHTSVIHRALKLVEECAQQKDAQGKPKYTMIILGNWEKTAFDLFAATKEGQKLMKFFKPENIVLSSACKLMKPDKDIFEYTIKKYALDPEYCVFIDDQIANIDTAHACGMRTIHLENSNYKKVRKALKELKIM